MADVQNIHRIGADSSELSRFYDRRNLLDRVHFNKIILPILVFLLKFLMNLSIAAEPYFPLSIKSIMKLNVWFLLFQTERQYFSSTVWLWHKSVGVWKIYVFKLEDDKFWHFYGILGH